MTGSSRWWIVLPLSVLVAVGCGDRTGDRTGGAEGAPAAVGAEQQSVSAADERAIESYELSMDRVRSFVRAYENLHALEETDPDLERRLDALAEAELDDAASLEEVVAAVEREPQVRRAIEAAGISARDFVMIQVTLFPAYMFVTLEEVGLPSPAASDWVIDRHIEFVRANRAAIDREMERIQELGFDDDEW